LYVTDGGQVDNLGLLELLSRRCGLIICFDGSGDGLLSTNTFDEVRQLAWDRYRVRFSTVGGDLDPTIPSPPEDPDPYHAVGPGLLTKAMCASSEASSGTASWSTQFRKRVARSNVAELEIHYPDGQIGTLIFAKAVLTTETPSGILDFAQGSRRFPRDSTADQFLEPDQVKNYQAIGRYLGECAAALAEPHLPPSSGPRGADPPPLPPEPPAGSVPERRRLRLRIIRFRTT
jgi:hypothetical protein